VNPSGVRIFHTEASKGWAGQEIRILNESAGMRKRGYDVRLVAPADAQIVVEAKRYGVPVHSLPLDKRRPSSIRALLRLYKELQPDVVITHSSSDTWLVAISAKLSRHRPAVVRMRHLSTPVAGGRLNRWLYGAALDKLVTTGTFIRLMLIEKLNLDPNSIVSIPTGTDISRYVTGDKEKARRELSLPVSSPIIGIVAALRSWKGHRFLISALQDPRLANAVLVMVGDGPQQPTLEAQIAEAGLKERVIFAGRRDDVWRWLPAFDVFALPSTGHETTPQAIQQAMACGIPVVTTPAGAGLELVTDGETGLVVESENPAALADGIARVLNDKALADKLATVGPKHVRAHFTETAMLDSMEKVVHEVMQKR
jgi:glycosyltransferase involved in cell wall biosynthesis